MSYVEDKYPLVCFAFKPEFRIDQANRINLRRLIIVSIRSENRKNSNLQTTHSIIHSSWYAFPIDDFVLLLWLLEKYKAFILYTCVLQRFQSEQSYFLCSSYPLWDYYRREDIIEVFIILCPSRYLVFDTLHKDCDITLCTYSEALALTTYKVTFKLFSFDVTLQ